MGNVDETKMINNVLIEFLNSSFVKLASSIPNLGDTSHDRYVQNTTVPQVDKLFEKM
jgi:hypothetical protein